MADEDDPEFTNGDIEGIERLIYTDNAMPSYPNDGGDIEIDAGIPDVVVEPSSAISDDLHIGVLDVDIGTLDDDYGM
ncbi:hypothetical protein PIB30_112454 [Stylosanthes scabra]|uniref:Uncharacterized protein n=1 Tax=Stylosanthes scabra TaxID=79078 RepID=A0ABU6ZZI6_9FABA|nr:hypothetical protein [Stylosanthes scabra]